MKKKELKQQQTEATGRRNQTSRRTIDDKVYRSADWHFFDYEKTELDEKTELYPSIIDELNAVFLANKGRISFQDAMIIRHHHKKQGSPEDLLWRPISADDKDLFNQVS